MKVGAAPKGMGMSQEGNKTRCSLSGAFTFYKRRVVFSTTLEISLETSE